MLGLEVPPTLIKRVLGVLGKRLARYGLTLHPDKTRFVDFRNTAFALADEVIES